VVLVKKRSLAVSHLIYRRFTLEYLLDFPCSAQPINASLFRFVAVQWADLPLPFALLCRHPLVGLRSFDTFPQAI